MHSESWPRTRMHGPARLQLAERSHVSYHRASHRSTPDMSRLTPPLRSLTSRLLSHPPFRSRSCYGGGGRAGGRDDGEGGAGTNIRQAEISFLERTVVLFP
eukprot:gene11728-biopygen16887